MTKQDIIDTLTADFYRVDTPVLKETIGTLRKYQVRLYDRDGDNMGIRLSGFMVDNEGEGNEIAFWLDARPPTRQTRNQFMNDVKTYLNTKVNDNTFDSVIITQSSQGLGMDTAEGWAVRELTPGQREQVKVVVFRRGANIIHEIVQDVKRTSE